MQDNSQPATTMMRPSLFDMSNVEGTYINGKMPKRKVTIVLKMSGWSAVSPDTAEIIHEINRKRVLSSKINPRYRNTIWNLILSRQSF